MAHAPRGEDMTPPRDNWERPPEVMGYVPVEDFKPPGDHGTPVAMLRMALRKVNIGTFEGVEVVFRSGTEMLLSCLNMFINSWTCGCKALGAGTRPRWRRSGRS